MEYPRLRAQLEAISLETDTMVPASVRDIAARLLDLCETHGVQPMCITSSPSPAIIFGFTGAAGYGDVEIDEEGISAVVPSPDGPSVWAVRDEPGELLAAAQRVEEAVHGDPLRAAA